MHLSLTGDCYKQQKEKLFGGTKILNKGKYTLNIKDQRYHCQRHHISSNDKNFGVNPGSPASMWLRETPQDSAVSVLGEQ